MELIHLQQEKHHAQIVQQHAVVIALKHQDYVHHVNQVMDIPAELVRNVNRDIIQQEEQIHVKVVQLDQFQKLKVHQVVQHVLLELMLIQEDQYVQNVLQEHIAPLDLEVVQHVQVELLLHQLELQVVFHVHLVVMVIVLKHQDIVIIVNLVMVLNTKVIIMMNMDI